MTKTFAISLALAAATMALGACSSEPETPAPEAGETAAEAPVDAPVTTPDADGIPADMLGVWDYVAGTCDPASDMRLEIAADHLTFYESYGTIQSVTRDGDDVTIALAMEGEGETWEESTTYRLVEGGTLLESSLPDPMGDGLMRRKRCEG